VPTPGSTTCNEKTVQAGRRETRLEKRAPSAIRKGVTREWSMIRESGAMLIMTAWQMATASWRCRRSVIKDYGWAEAGFGSGESPDPGVLSMRRFPNHHEMKQR